jgi:hypothetical protein
MALFGRKPAEPGLIESYSVVYKGGHPDYPKEKAGMIEFKIFSDRFEFVPTFGTKRWFKGLVILFEKTSSLKIVERQVGTLEGIFGGVNSRQLNQPNNIHITYQLDGEMEVLLRLEMISGITVMGAAKKCQELVDRLNNNNVFEKFRPKPSSSGQPGPVSFDIPTQIGKLADLRDRQIISQQEFDQKKTDLLSKM